MKPDRWPLFPLVLGILLVAVAAADIHELMMRARDDDCWLFARAELAIYGGLWLVSGLGAWWARASAIGVFGCVLMYDFARFGAGQPPRDGFGRFAVGPGCLMCSDVVIIFALLRWRPTTNRVAWIDTHPGRLAGTTLIVMAMGAAVNWSQIGYFPIVATARSGDSPSVPGLDYLVYLPRGYYRSHERWPVILDLHGAGLVGRDIERVRARGLPGRIEGGVRLPFVIVAPQSPSRGWNVEALDGLLDEVLRRYRVDRDRVYLTGASMGGYGVWALATAHPERFAAIAPICGGGDPALADRLRGVPTWAFHGAEDRVIPADESRKMVAAQERAGGEVKLTIYPGVGHDAATPTYADWRLYDWLLSHRRPRGEPGME